MNIKRIVASGSASLLLLLIAARVAFAGGYTTHEEIPGAGGTTDSFPELLQQLYNFSIGAAAILAMIMIGAGAFMYIVTSAGNASKMANAKDMIFSAIFGLVIAMIAWITLFLINPDLVVGDIDAIPNTGHPDYVEGPDFD
jgi:cytochrome bd-type quinol oxidase subunit 1